LTLDDLEDQYCNKNCIGWSTSFLATAGLSCTTLHWALPIRGVHRSVKSHENWIPKSHGNENNNMAYNGNWTRMGIGLK